MKCKRSSFGAVYFEDSKKIYAFGGLEGKENGFHPVLSGMECEAYDITKNEWEEFKPKPHGVLTVVHNDFNPRNVAIRKNGDPCIYDWELAVIHLPQRDIFEFLAFTLDKEIGQEQLSEMLNFHYQLVLEFNDPGYSWENYLEDFKLAGKDFLITRVNFYLAGSTLVHYPFMPRVFEHSVQILESVDGLADK